ncbi:signal peptide peptidase SppA [Colwellia sp. 39_35_sub15_T18]|nr:signal peptide peptidase SppA [Colwellia sp. 39_35_sub15_T18]
MSAVANLFKRILSGVWWLFTLTRSVVLNFIFIIFFVSLIVMIASDKDQVKVPEKTALVLNLVGDLVEQKHEINPMDAFLNEALGQEEDDPEILLADVIDVINKARNDDRIELLVLQLQGLRGAGLTKLQDVGKALVDYKSSGKKIIALGDNFSQDQYYLASYADDIWLNPQGFMLLDGYGRYKMYFKSALEKLAIKQHIFRVGTFKSAVEPFLRDDMSAAAKEANKLWLNDLWGQYKHDVATQRGFTIENFDESITDLLDKFSQSNSSFAEYALSNKWVDQLKTRDQMRIELIELVGENSKGDSYSHIGFKDYLAANATTKPFSNKSTNKVAIIVAKGTILNGTQKPGTIGGDSTAKLLRKARMNEQVKAVVLRVDSPGGSAFASEIIRQEVELLKAAGKPVIASMGTYAASGGYWISAPADKIYAAPSTITGSIGIFGMMMTFEDSLSKLGIHTDGVGTTDIAGFGPTQPLTDGMAQLFQLSINKGYQDFITLVAENRNMTLEEVDAIAQGRVWSGAKAKELGLVDELGNLTDAIVAAAELAELKKYDTLLIEKEPSSRNKFIQQMMGKSSKLLALVGVSSSDLMSPSTLDNKPVSQLVGQLQKELAAMNQFNDPQGTYTLCLACSAQ